MHLVALEISLKNPKSLAFLSRRQSRVREKNKSEESENARKILMNAWISSLSNLFSLRHSKGYEKIRTTSLAY